MMRDTDYACCIKEVRLDKGRIRGGRIFTFKYFEPGFRGFPDAIR